MEQAQPVWCIMHKAGGDVMPKLRDDLLRNLSPIDQELMKRFRKRPFMAYTLKELLPPKAAFLEELLLQTRLNSLISQGLVMQIFVDGQIYYAKAKRGVLKRKAPYQ
jgi:hypothetical protein